MSVRRLGIILHHWTSATKQLSACIIDFYHLWIGIDIYIYISIHTCSRHCLIEQNYEFLMCFFFKVKYASSIKFNNTLILTNAIELNPSRILL